MMKTRTVIAGIAALALASSGAVAGAVESPSPVDSSGAIHGCWLNAALNGSHVFVLQDAGTNCPKGTTAISWNQQGPAGASGPQGPAGTVGPAGPAGTTGVPGTDGNSVLSGVGAPSSSVGNDGDFYIDTSAEFIYGPKSSGTWPTNGTRLVGPAGAAGPAGPAGAPGSGINSISNFNGIACTTNGGAAGTVAALGADSNNVIALQCTASADDPECTHINGIGQNYTDCNDLWGVQGSDNTFNKTMATDAAQTAYQAELSLGNIGSVVDESTGNICNGGPSMVLEEIVPGQGVYPIDAWYYAGYDAGLVATFPSGYIYPAKDCPAVLGSWD